MAINLTIAKRVLGVASIAIGVLAVASPARLSRALGLQQDEEAVSAFGAREIASGAGLLSPVKPGPWFWMRVGGDVMDIASISKALKPSNPKRHIAGLVALTVVGIAVVDTLMAVQALVDKEENERAAT